MKPTKLIIAICLLALKVQAIPMSSTLSCDNNIKTLGLPASVKDVKEIDAVEQGMTGLVGAPPKSTVGYIVFTGEKCTPTFYRAGTQEPFTKLTGYKGSRLSSCSKQVIWRESAILADNAASHFEGWKPQTGSSLSKSESALKKWNFNSNSVCSSIKEERETNCPETCRASLKEAGGQDAFCKGEFGAKMLNYAKECKTCCL